jgi:hypothetical protein
MTEGLILGVAGGMLFGNCKRSQGGFYGREENGKVCASGLQLSGGEGQ